MSLLSYMFLPSLSLSLSLSLAVTDVTAIIFVVACSSFNMVIREDLYTVSFTIICHWD